MKREHALALRRLIEKAVISLNDEDALSGIELFPVWIIDKNYAIDDRVRYGEKLYRCVQAHTSQASWTPDLTPALWVRVSIDEWPEWIQPTGAHDAYDLGAKVTHNGLHYISNVASNIWEPGVFGWDLA